MIQGGAVGELMARLGEAPRARRAARRAGRALGDPSLELVYWLPERRRFVDARGQRLRAAGGRLRRARSPRSSARASASRRSSTTPRSRRAAGTCEAVGAAAGARAGERAAGRRAAREGRGAARARASGCSRSGSRSAAGSSATCTTAPSSGSCRWRSTCGSRAPSCTTTRSPPSGCWPAPARSSTRRSGSCASWRAASTRRCSPTAASPPRSRRSRPRAPVPVELGELPGRAPARGGRAGRLLRRGRGAHERGQVRGGQRTRPCTWSATTAAWSWRWPTTASGGADPEHGTGLRGLADRLAVIEGRLEVESENGAGNDHHGEDPVRVVVADDSVLLREGVVRLLEEWGFDVVAQAGDAEDLMRKVNAHKPDVAVVDIRMPPDQHRRRPARRARDPRRAPRHRRARALPVRRGGLRARAGRRRRRRRRLPAQGPRGRRRALRRRRSSAWPRAARRSTPRWWPSSSAARAARTRSRSSRRASARCSS